MRFGGFLRCPVVKLAPLAAGLVLLGPIQKARAQQPLIRHSALECLPNDQFPQVTAVVEPGQEIRTCKVYFRSDKYVDFYYVEMEPGDAETNTFLAVLPMPSLETQRVVYYIEAVDQSFNGTRTEEFIPQVTNGSECRRRDPAVAWFSGANPGVVVGATQAGMAAVPPGFQAAGIAGFVTAAGVASGVGGGIGAGTVAAVGAGAAAAAGAVVATGGGDETTTTTAPSSSSSGSGAAATTTTTTPPSSPTTTSIPIANEAPQACFRTEPDPPVIQEGEQIRLDGSCSQADPSGGGTDRIAKYEWDLGDGRTREGRLVTPIYRTAGTYRVTLTVTDSGGSMLTSSPWHAQREAPKSDTMSKEITVERKRPETEQLRACFNVSKVGTCTYKFDGTCSVGDIISYDWDLDVDGVLKRATDSGPVVTHDWLNFGCGSTGQLIRVKLRVTAEDGATDAVEQQVSVDYLSRILLRNLDVPTSFASSLHVPDSGASARGQVLVNGSRLDVTTGSGSFRHQLRGRPGENTVVARPSEAKGGGVWRFDFRGAENFVAGSLKVKSGQVVSLDAYSVAFRVSGPGERFEFSYQLAQMGH